MSQKHGITAPTCKIKYPRNDNYVVDESLLYMTMLHRDLVILEGCKAILRRDYDNIPNKVKLLSGDGAKSEQTHVGFVGPGMLTGVITDDLSSVSASVTILKVIEEVGTNHSPGVLLIIQNYIKYCINFSLAVSRAKDNGINVQMLIIDDNIDMNLRDKTTQTQELTSILYIYKVAGAMADEGKDLNSIYDICNKIVHKREIATFSVHINPMVSTETSAFYKSSNKQIIVTDAECKVEDEGRLLQKSFISAKDEAVTKIASIVNTSKESIEGKMHNFNSFAPGHNVAILVNNIGGCSQLMNNLFTLEVLKQVKSLGLNVQRAYSGLLLTALNSCSFHVSLLDLSSDTSILKYLDAPTSAPTWPKILSLNLLGIENEPEAIIPGKYCRTTHDDYLLNVKPRGPTIEGSSGEAFLTALIFACEALMGCVKQLNIMDEDSGDGDCGTSLARGSNAIKTAIKESKIKSTRPYVVFTQISYIIEKEMGGLQGKFYSLFFNAAATVFAECNSAHPISMHTWFNALTVANKAISDFGKVSVGDRTMLDPLMAAQRELANALSLQCHPIKAFSKMVRAAEKSATLTTYMQAPYKRGDVVKSKMFQHPDPGAHAVGIWLRAAYEAVKLKFNGSYEI